MTTKTGELIAELKSTKDILVENIDKLIDREFKLNIIATKSDNIGKLSQNINNFASSIRKEEERKRNKNIVILVAIVVIIILLFYFMF